MDQPVPEAISSGGALPPISLSQRQVELCGRLDSFHTLYNLRVKPSDMFRGALFASREECRSNPDWIAQAANSLREILYPFYSREVDGVPTNKKEVLQKYGSVRADDTAITEMGRLYGKLNALTHHGNAEKSKVDFPAFTPTDFAGLLDNFERVMFDTLARQVDVHKDIDAILAAGVPPTTGEKSV